MANASTIHLYAEHLRNIRCLSIQASLKTAANGQTAATLSADGNTLSLAHEGETATIRLPVAVPDHHNSATLRIPAVATRDLSFRLQIREDVAVDGQLPDDGGQRPENILPWTARSLTTSSEIRCKKCHQLLVDRARISIWKDLPSESWAEMMEFWHCHKPDTSGEHNHAGHKGFSADSMLALELGVGMVNPIEFLVMKDDTRNIKVRRNLSSSPPFNHLGRVKKNQLFPTVRSLSLEGVGIQVPKIEPHLHGSRTSLAHSEGQSGEVTIAPPGVSLFLRHLTGKHGIKD